MTAEIRPTARKLTALEKEQLRERVRIEMEKKAPTKSTMTQEVPTMAQDAPANAAMKQKAPINEGIPPFVYVLLAFYLSGFASCWYLMRKSN